MKTLYDKMRDNRDKILQREAIRRYHEDAQQQKKVAEEIRRAEAVYRANFLMREYGNPEDAIS